VDLLSAGASSSALVPLLNVPDWPSRRERLERELTPKIREKVSMVSVVGQGLTGGGGALPKFFGTLKQIEADVVQSTAGPLRLSAVVPRAQLADAQRALYAAFVG
jgi:aspartokinase